VGLRSERGTTEIITGDEKDVECKYVEQEEGHASQPMPRKGSEYETEERPSSPVHSQVRVDIGPQCADPYMQAFECLVEMGGRDIRECRAKKILNMDAPCT
jgi:hypothetical protein